MEMLRLVQKASANKHERAKYQVREVSVVRDIWRDPDMDHHRHHDMGPFPRTRNFFADVKSANPPSCGEDLSDAEIDRRLARFYQPDIESDVTIPLKITPLRNVKKDADLAFRELYGLTADIERMNVRLAKVTARRQRVDATTTVVSMKGWGSPRNVSEVGRYWGNQGTFEIDWYRQAALIVTLPRRRRRQHLQRKK